jgi:catechol 2,3-dioxygenase-like lactoylglutathione lyase family enzyme
MTIRLDHTVVPAHDKVKSAEFFAEIFGLKVDNVGDHFAQVQVNDSLTLDFADDPEHAGSRHGLHFAFHISEAEFDEIFARVKRKQIPYGSAPFSPSDGEINHRRGGRGFYFADPAGHLLEVLTVPETGSWRG